MNTMTISIADPAAPHPALAPPRDYFPQLDALRVFAVLAVFYQHFVVVYGTPSYFGDLGVRLFFVLSGFLITRILFVMREKPDFKVGSSLRVFYIRRTLRIFPLYYFILAVSFFVSPMFRESWPWYVTYLTNIKGTLDGHLGFAAHFWTLAIEEQFYLLWPLLMLTLSRRSVLQTIFIAIAIGPAYRISGLACGLTSLQTHIFTLGEIDALAMGALLAYVWVYEPARLQCVGKICLLVGAVLFLPIILAEHFWPVWPAYDALACSASSCVFLWLVARSAQGFTGVAGRIFSWAPLLYLGKISYGLYAYHVFVPQQINPFLERSPLYQLLWFRVFVYVALTVIVSVLSWHFLESPINNLKDRFTGKLRSRTPKPMR